MATGDQTDITGRLKAMLPARWFSGSTPVLDGVLAGIAALFMQIYSLYAYAKSQTRILTSTDAWLDMVSGDYFGANLPRQVSESDASFLARIRANLFVQRTSRPAMVSVLTTLTGHEPLILEPGNPRDMGVMGVPGSKGYCGVGRMGSMAVPFNALIIAYRPAVTNQITPGAAFASAPKISAMGTPVSQGYTGSLGLQQSSITDAAIYAAVEATRPAGTTVGVCIKNWVDPTPPVLLDDLGNTIEATDDGTAYASVYVNQ